MTTRTMSVEDSRFLASLRIKADAGLCELAERQDEFVRLSQKVLVLETRDNLLVAMMHDRDRAIARRNAIIAVLLLALAVSLGFNV